MKTLFFERPEGTLAFSDYGAGGENRLNGNGNVNNGDNGDNGDNGNNGKGGKGGEPVLMLPGMGALRSEYRYLAPKLSEAGFRAVTLDLRGHGESSVPWKTYDVPSVGGDILALIEHLDAGPAHLIGTSFAAAPAVWAAAKRPDRVRSLVLISAFVRDVKINPVMKTLFWLMMHNPWRVRLWGMYYGTLYPTHKPADFKDYLNQLMKNLAQPGRMHAADALANCSREPSAESLSEVRVPTLVIMGTKDSDFPDPKAEGKIIAKLTRGRLALVEGAGHYPQTEMPEETAPLVINFLKSAASPETLERPKGQEEDRDRMSPVGAGRVTASENAATTNDMESTHTSPSTMRATMGASEQR